MHFGSPRRPFSPDLGFARGTLPDRVDSFGPQRCVRRFTFFRYFWLCDHTSFSAKPERTFPTEPQGFLSQRTARIFPLLGVTVAIGVAALVFIRYPWQRTHLCFHSSGVSFRAGFWISLFTFTFNWVRVLTNPNPGIRNALGLALVPCGGRTVLFSLSLSAPGGPHQTAPRRLSPCHRGPRSGDTILGKLSYPERFLLGYTQSLAVYRPIAIGALLYLCVERTQLFLRSRRALCIGLTALGVLTVLTCYARTDVFWAPDRVFTPTILALGLVFFPSEACIWIREPTKSFRSARQGKLRLLPASRLGFVSVLECFDGVRLLGRLSTFSRSYRGRRLFVVLLLRTARGRMDPRVISSGQVSPRA